MPPHSSAAEVLLLDNKLASNAGPLASVKKNNALNGKSQEPATTASSFLGDKARGFTYSQSHIERARPSSFYVRDLARGRARRTTMHRRWRRHCECEKNPNKTHKRTKPASPERTKAKLSHALVLLWYRVGRISSHRCFTQFSLLSSVSRPCRGSKLRIELEVRLAWRNA